MPSKMGNTIIKAIVESPFHALLGPRFAVITFKGRKTGRTYSTPINVYREGDAYTVVSKRERTWWRNLRAGEHARLRLSGREFDVVGEVLENIECVKQGLAAHLTRRPKQARYFGLTPDGEGRIADADLERAAEVRVLILLRLA